MAKVRVTETDDQIDLLMHQTRETAKMVNEAKNMIALFKQEVADFGQKVMEGHESKVVALNELILSRMAKFDQSAKDAVSQINLAPQSIQRVTEQGIAQVERAVRQKAAMSKTGIWIASIAALLMVAFVAFFEVERRVDLSTLQDAKQQTQQANALIQGIQQWAKDNPNDSRSFWKWAEQHGLTNKK